MKLAGQHFARIDVGQNSMPDLQGFTYARKVAEEEHVSMNQFFVMAIAEKVSALKTETYFRERQSRGELNAFDTWLNASSDADPMVGDELT